MSYYDDWYRNCLFCKYGGDYRNTGIAWVTALCGIDSHVRCSCLKVPDKCSLGEDVENAITPKRKEVIEYE